MNIRDVYSYYENLVRKVHDGEEVSIDELYFVCGLMNDAYLICGDRTIVAVCPKGKKVLFCVFVGDGENYRLVDRARVSSEEFESIARSVTSVCDLMLMHKAAYSDGGEKTRNYIF